MKNMSPPLAITMGDASGIGPEIVAKTLANGGERAVVFGSVIVMSMRPVKRSFSRGSSKS